MSVPQALAGTPLRTDFLSASDAARLVARIGMTMAAHNLSGYVLFIMDVPSIENFMAQVGRLFRLPEQDDSLSV